MTTTAKLPSNQKITLLAVMRDKLRLKHYSYRTEQSYINWVRRYIKFHYPTHPRELAAKGVEEFLIYLAVENNVSPSTQNQAKSSLLFLYKHVLEIDLLWIENIESAHTPKHLPTVLNLEEVAAVIANLEGVQALIISFLFGTGMRLMEALRLRVKDIDFVRNEITIHDGKGFKDRVTMLPLSLKSRLNEQINKAKLLHQQDLQNDFDEVDLPYALT